MTVDDLIAEIARRGLRLNNLFQLADGRWQANITDSERLWEFGRGDTAVEALQAALQISATTEPELGIKQVVRVLNLERLERSRTRTSSRAPAPIFSDKTEGVLF